jgi:hypothetical protein
MSNAQTVLESICPMEHLDPCSPCGTIAKSAQVAAFIFRCYLLIRDCFEEFTCQQSPSRVSSLPCE